MREANPKSGVVACVPFQSNSLEIRRENGVAKANSRDHLVGLKVIHGTADFRTGDTLYFEGDQCVMPWAKRIYTIDEVVKFILAPIDQVRIIERAGPPPAVGPHQENR